MPEVSRFHGIIIRMYFDEGSIRIFMPITTSKQPYLPSILRLYTKAVCHADSKTLSWAGQRSIKSN